MKEKKQIEFSLHKYQIAAWNALFTDKKREVALLSGVQGGKTIFGTFCVRNIIEDYAQPGDNILVGAPTYKILAQATLHLDRCL